MQRNRPLAQQYENYTQEDFKVWSILYQKQMDLLNQHASVYYLVALKKVGFNADAIPNFKELNEILALSTGWQIIVVPAIVPQEAFFKLLSQKIFPTTCWLRTFAELEYIEEPDMFHDVFGHVPLLANKQYAMFMEAFGKLALQWLGHSDMIDMLSRLYWFTVEFGLIQEGSEIKIYGAGILSSPGETLHSMDTGITKHSFNIETILGIAYRTDILQDQYFVISSLEQLYQVLPATELALKMRSKIPALNPI